MKLWVNNAIDLGLKEGDRLFFDEPGFFTFHNGKSKPKNRKNFLKFKIGRLSEGVKKVDVLGKDGKEEGGTSACYCHSCRDKFNEEYSRWMPHSFTDEVKAFQDKSIYRFF